MFKNNKLAVKVLNIAINPFLGASKFFTSMPSLILAMSLMIFGSAASYAENKLNKEFILKNATIIEMVIYTTKDGVDNSEHIKKSEEVGKVLANMAGFVGRHFTKSAEGKWVDLVYWKDLDAAQRAADIFMTLPESQSFIADINETDMQFIHTEVLSAILP